VCVPCNDPGWNTFDEVDQLPVQLRREIDFFFSVYKDLDADKHSETKGWGDSRAAWETIEGARERFRSEGSPS
jgi:inorganic pyrophosphatase